MIYGYTEGVRDTILEELERMVETEYDRSAYLPDRLLQQLLYYTSATDRGIMVYLARDGEVLDIAMGNMSADGLPELHLRRNIDRLSGIRLIRTRPDGDPKPSEADEQALQILRFDSLCVIGVSNGMCTGITANYLGELEYGRMTIETLGPVKPGRVPQGLWLHEIETADERLASAIAKGGITVKAEKVLLVGIESEDSLAELSELAETAGAAVMGKVLQKRMKPEPGTYIGTGKAEELELLCRAQEIDLVIFDDELTGAQEHNLEEIIGVRVVDRTALILDIFAKHAVSSEGKLQVALAQEKYRLPKLSGKGTALSRLGAGIGTRGPGETRLETDRRIVRRRIVDMTRELEDLKRQRVMHRERREKTEQTVVALVGYTNAGKSTLLNALSGSDVLVEDKLFATLDPIVRRVDLGEKRECLLVDTVGFIRKLPHELVEAFHSTLEEAVSADMLVIVSDISSPYYREQRETVYQVLKELGAGDKPVVEALNKADLVEPGLVFEPADGVMISAKNGTGLDKLRKMIAERVSKLRREIELEIPFAKGAALSLLHAKGQVLSEEYTETGTKVKVLADTTLEMRVRKMLGEK
ncbi:MAG: GTPase HflX [Clostridia bacterium]|nr:GTPase HflX [Clostridia bacterium]